MWIPMLWIYSHDKYFNSVSVLNVFIRRLQSSDFDFFVNFFETRTQLDYNQLSKLNIYLFPTPFQ